MFDKFQNVRKVLVLAPHTDDGELGVGGTISRLTKMGIDVTYVAFSTAVKSVPKGFKKNVLKEEVRNATLELGIKPSNLILFDYEVRKLNYHRQEILEELIKLKQFDFDIIFVPSANDVHQDHATISMEGIRAFKNSTVLGYELIWNNLNFNTALFVELDIKDVENKIMALSRYKSQAHRSYMDPNFIRSHAITRGVQIGFKYAESFEAIRIIV